MKIAFFIMLHKNSRQFTWLWDALYNDHDIFLIHVDKKASNIKTENSDELRDFQRIIGNKRNVVTMPSRSINWGGWSLSKLELDAIEFLLKNDAEWKYFVPLSGQCYPLRKETEFRLFLSDRFPLNFVEMRKISCMSTLSWHPKRMRMLELPFRAIKIPIMRKPPRNPPIEWTGSQWCVLSREFCNWALQSDIAHRISKYLSTTILSDELLIQNLLAQSPFYDNQTDFLHYLEWPGPKILQSEDFDAIISSNKFFGRKFDVGVGNDALTMIAQHNDFKMPAQ